MAKPERNDDAEPGDGPDSASLPDSSGDGRHWYSWSRWKYVGGGLFLTLSVIGVGYVIWDIIDLLPKPVTIDMVRAALRESPGRITDMVAVAGLISFGPPAGVDLMFGATEAAKQWARERQKKERAEGRIEGRAEGRQEGRAEGRTKERNDLRQYLQTLKDEGQENVTLQELMDKLRDGDQ